MSRRLRHIVSWRVAVPSYYVFDVIASLYKETYAIHSEFLWCISDILLFQSRVPGVHFFSFSVSLVV